MKCQFVARALLPRILYSINVELMKIRNANGEREREKKWIKKQLTAYGFICCCRWWWWFVLLRLAMRQCLCLCGKIVENVLTFLYCSSYTRHTQMYRISVYYRNEIHFDYDWGARIVSQRYTHTLTYYINSGRKGANTARWCQFSWRKSLKIE